MSEENTQATTCPLCLGADELSSMVSVEIDRIIPKGRATVLICRSCTGAVVEAAKGLDEPLPPRIAKALAEFEEAAAVLNRARAIESTHSPVTTDRVIGDLEFTPRKEEPDDGSSTN